MSQRVTVVFQPYGRRISVKPGENLLEAAIRGGISIRSICGGKGSCGKCKVIVQRGEVNFEYNPEEGLLTRDEIKKGYVLACLTKCYSDCEVLIPPETRIEGQRIQADARLPTLTPDSIVKKIFISPIQLGVEAREHLRRILEFTGVKSIPGEVEERLRDFPQCCRDGATLTIRRFREKAEILDLEEGNTVDRLYGVAVDIGTTKIVTYLVDLTNGNVLGSESDYNRQLMFGEDLVSRVSYAMDKPNGLKMLQEAVVETINSLIEKLCVKCGIRREEVLDACVAGNTVMTYLFAGRDASPLLKPRAEVQRKPFVLSASELGLSINPKAQVYCLPCVSRFLGGDAVGDVLLSGMYESPEISLLIDIGTNVEVVLGSEGWFLSTTAAAGPAFEGWGIRFGMRSVEGAIDHVKINPKTLKAEYTVIGGGKPRGICGSGLIDALAEMFRNGILDNLGKFNKGVKSPYIRVGEDGYEYVVAPREEAGVDRDIVITEKDIANLIDSKAAACAAIAVLLKKMRLSVYDVKRVFICGAFGSYMDPNSAIAIGLLPEFPEAKLIYLGNGSVAGAYMTLVSQRFRRKAEEIAELTTYFDLLKDADFMDEYTAAYFLPGKQELFPTWWRASRRRTIS